MIEIEFFESKKFLTGFSICGHSGFNKNGMDIVCAAVSCAVRMCCNGVTEIVGASAKIFSADGVVRLQILDNFEGVQVLLKSLVMELGIIQSEYSKFVSIKRIGGLYYVKD